MKWLLKVRIKWGSKLSTRKSKGGNIFKTFDFSLQILTVHGLAYISFQMNEYWTESQCSKLNTTPISSCSHQSPRVMSPHLHVPDKNGLLIMDHNAASNRSSKHLVMGYQGEGESEARRAGFQSRCDSESWKWVHFLSCKIRLNNYIDLKMQWSKCSEIMCKSFIAHYNYWEIVIDDHVI